MFKVGRVIPFISFFLSRIFLRVRVFHTVDFLLDSSNKQNTHFLLGDLTSISLKTICTLVFFKKI